MANDFFSSFWALTELDQCESTQLLAVESIRQGRYRQPFIFSCLQQSSGFGQRGNKWVHCGEALAISLAWEAKGFDVAPDDRWPSWVSLWVLQALNSFDSRLRGQVRLKWPNDLIAHNEKLGGVLVSQIVHQGRTFRIAGLGLNLAWTESKPYDLPAIDLKTLIGEPIDRVRLFHCIMQSLTKGIGAPRDEKALDLALESLRAI